MEEGCKTPFAASHASLCRSLVESIYGSCIGGPTGVDLDVLGNAESLVKRILMDDPALLFYRFFQVMKKTEIEGKPGVYNPKAPFRRVFDEPVWGEALTYCFFDLCDNVCRALALVDKTFMAICKEHIAAFVKVMRAELNTRLSDELKDKKPSMFHLLALFNKEAFRAIFLETSTDTIKQGSFSMKDMERLVANVQTFYYFRTQYAMSNPASRCGWRMLKENPWVTYAKSEVGGAYTALRITSPEALFHDLKEDNPKTLVHEAEITQFPNSTELGSIGTALVCGAGQAELQIQQARLGRANHGSFSSKGKRQSIGPVHMEELTEEEKGNYLYAETRADYLRGVTPSFERVRRAQEHVARRASMRATRQRS